MKRSVLATALASAVAAVVTVAATVAPAYADSLYTWGNLCHNGTVQCLNQTAGTPRVPVQFWSHTTQGEPNNDWNFWQVAGNRTVNCGSGFPFAGEVPAATCNAWGINGDPVLKIAWAPRGRGSGFCLDTTQYDQSDSWSVATGACSPSGAVYNAYLFVYTKAGFLISGAGTMYQFEATGNRKRVYLGTCAAGSTSNGSHVCLTYNHGIGWNLLSPP